MYHMYRISAAAAMDGRGTRCVTHNATASPARGLLPFRNPYPPNSHPPKIEYFRFSDLDVLVTLLVGFFGWCVLLLLANVTCNTFLGWFASVSV